MANTWDEILQNSPTMKTLFESKVKEEVDKVRAENSETTNTLTQKIKTLEGQNAELIKKMLIAGLL